MKEKITKKSESKKLSKSEERRIKLMKEEKKNSSNAQPTDSNASLGGVKYRATFLIGQSFRGNYYEKGQSVILSEEQAKAYSKRSIKFERV